MRLASGYEERKARIEMVPLIDCMFLLLVFFMYAMVSMTVHRGIRVNLPKGAGAKRRRRRRAARRPCSSGATARRTSGWRWNCCRA
jgi:biopolymer transport protein ExbD